MTAITNTLGTYSYVPPGVREAQSVGRGAIVRSPQPDQLLLALLHHPPTCSPHTSPALQAEIETTPAIKIMTSA